MVVSFDRPDDVGMSARELLGGVREAMRRRSGAHRRRPSVRAVRRLALARHGSGNAFVGVGDHRRVGCEYVGLALVAGPARIV
jgi:hypothetical protein